MGTTQDFVQLHNHTHYSVQDALPSPKALVKKAREMGFPAIAITDHGRMGGSIEFVEACRKVDEKTDPIKPIVGIEAYTVADHRVKEQVIRADGKKGRPKSNHLTLLAMNGDGYRNLVQAASLGAEEGYYYEPRISWPVVQEHNEGVIAMSGCLGSEVNQAFLRGDDEEAERVMRRFKDVFGDRYYAELQFHGIPEQKECMPKLAALARKLDIPCVASNDVHYLEPNDWQVHDILIQMRDLSVDRSGGKNGKKDAYGSHQFYMKDQAAMSKIFDGLDSSAVRNALLLSERVEDHLKLDSKHLLPSLPIPKDDERFTAWYKKHLPYNKPNEAYLAYRAFDGLQKLGLANDPIYKTRLRSELEQIWYMGVGDYFLIEDDLVQFMKGDNILFGIRGSGVGSLVNYCLGVCAIDPLRWNLMFERFLNPGRGTQYKVTLSELPFKAWFSEMGKQDQTLPTLRLRELAKANKDGLEEFGPDIAKEIWVLEQQGYAAYICDLADRGIKSSQNECQLWTAYFLGITDKRPDGGMIASKVATLPDVDTDMDDSRRQEAIAYTRTKYGEKNVAQIGTWGTYGAKAAVKGALKTSERFIGQFGEKAHAVAESITKTIPGKPGITIDEAISESDEFAQWARKYSSEVAIAQKLVGTISNLGVHAGGVLVSSEPIHDHSPVENSKGVLCSAFDMKSVERVGLVKYDFLGLATFQMLARALKLIEKRHGRVIDPAQIPLEDPKVFHDVYSKGKTSSVFQFASKGMQETLVQVQASNTEDLIAVAALYRPGPMAFIPDYAAGKRNPSSVKYGHPIIEKHLAVTYGIIVYQEQAMFLARDLAGFDWEETDKLRKAVSKKDPEAFAKVTKLFREKALARGVDKKVIDDLLSLMQKFAGYAFNRCLSAKTYIHTADGRRMHISKAYSEKPSHIMSMWEDGEIRPHAVKNIVKTGKKPVYRITTFANRTLKCTMEHRLLTTEGYKALSDMQVGTELIVQPRPVSDAQREARKANMKALEQTQGQKDRAADRMRDWQASRTPEEKLAHLRGIHEKHPDLGKSWCAKGTEKVRWLHANDPEWRAAHIERSIASVRDAYDTGPGYGHCSIASNGMWCASKPERAMCEWLIEQGIEFQMHKVLGNGRICDFYFGGVYWEMDGMDRVGQYFADKYDDLPYVVVTPEDFREHVARHLALEHASNGDPIVSIEYAGIEETYDIEMSDDGPKNFVANKIISHNSHSCSYAILSYWTAWLRTYYPSEWMAAVMQVDHDDENKMAVYRRECQLEKIKVNNPNVNESAGDTTVNAKGDIMLPLTTIKGVGSVAEAIVAEQPYTSMKDFVWRARPNRGLVIALGDNGALDCFPEVAALEDLHDIMQEFDRLVALRSDEEKRVAKAAKMKYTVKSLMDDFTGEEDWEGAVKAPAPIKPKAPARKTMKSPLKSNLFFDQDF